MSVGCFAEGRCAAQKGALVQHPYASINLPRFSLYFSLLSSSSKLTLQPLNGKQANDVGKLPHFDGCIYIVAVGKNHAGQKGGCTTI